MHIGKGRQLLLLEERFFRRRVEHEDKDNYINEVVNNTIGEDDEGSQIEKQIIPGEIHKQNLSRQIVANK